MAQSTAMALVVSIIWTLSAPAQEAEPDWTIYRDSQQSSAFLKGLASRHPRLTEVFQIGKTLKGTPLWIMRVTNPATGSADSKPAYYYDGNIHSSELTSAEVVHHFAWYVLSHYGKDPRITRLLDTRTLYLRPKFNPDGSDLSLKTIHSPRSTPRPYDNDGDGLLDEDPPNDLDGDGFITRMRIPNPKGRWKISPDDPRIMTRRGPDDVSGRFFDVASEGIDDDGDGRVNEDGVGGIDMNRNFPRNWGMEYQQRGAGPYPLSEPETRATVEFLHSHRNICGVFHGHTSGGFLYRLPSTTAWKNFPEGDQKLIEDLAAPYATTTDQPVRPSYTNPNSHRHGTLISWSYWDYGVVGYVPEFWGRFGTDYDKSGRISESERMRWDDENNGGRGFSPWARAQHPKFGEVEVGGWRGRFTTSNPPPSELPGEIKMYVPWMLWLAETTPRIICRDEKIQQVKKGVFRVSLTVENEGWLPTNITEQALKNRTAKPVRVHAKLHNASIVEGTGHTELGHMGGTRGGEDSPAATHSYEITVAADSPDARLVLTVVSEKGGTVRRSWELGTKR